MTLGIDEIRTPQIEVEPPEQYFAKMDISKEQKEERVKAANDFMDVLLFFFAYLAIQMEYGGDLEVVYEEFTYRFGNVVRRYARMDEYMEAYVRDVTNNIAELTVESLEVEWYTSSDRATAIGENEANSVLNYEELQAAIDNGYRFKEWRSERDNKVRKDHVTMDGRKIPIDEYFVFPDCMMLAPHDEVNGTARQICGCRCSLSYSRD